MLYFSEIGSELIIVSLRPFFVWVMMTLRALHANAKKNLADERACVRRLTFVAKNRGWPISMCAALSSQQFPHELVIRFILPETFAQPKVEEINRFDANARRIAANPVAPFHRPIISVSRLFKHCID